MGSGSRLPTCHSENEAGEILILTSLHFIGKQVTDKEIRAFQTAARSMKKWVEGETGWRGDSLPAVMPFELRPHDMEEPA